MARRRAAGRPQHSEKQIEAQIRDVWLRLGYYPVKTDAGRSGARLPVGFPDGLSFLPVIGTPFALAVLVELKTERGQLSDDQVKYHALLRAHGLTPVTLRDPAEAHALATEGRALRTQIQQLLKGRTR